jgi:hypothetical protein
MHDFEQSLFQEAMLHGGPSFAQELGRQTHHGFAQDTPKSEGFSWKVMGHIFLLPRRRPTEEIPSEYFIP